MDWFGLLKSLGIFTIIAGIIGYTIKGLITHYLSLDVEDYKKRLTLDVENHKNRVTYESTLKVEEFKSQLQIAAKKNEIVFSHLYEKRAKLIDQLIVMLREFIGEVIKFEAQVKNVELNLSNQDFLLIKAGIINKWGKIMDYALDNGHYLGDTLSSSITNIGASSPYWLRLQSIDDYRTGNNNDLVEHNGALLRQVFELSGKEFQRMLGIQ